MHDICKKNEKEIEKIVLVSNDTDFIPIMRYIIEYTEKSIILLTPLGTRKTGGAFSDIYKENKEQITIQRIERGAMAISRLPSTIEINKQKVKSPYTEFSGERLK